MSDFQSKIIEVKHLVTEVTDLFIKQKSVLDSMSETISKFGKGAKLPSEFSNAQKEVNKNLEKQSDLQKLIEENAKKQTSAIQKLTKEELSYTQAVEKGIKAKDKEILANQKLSDAYGQLSKRRNDAARALQNSIIETGKYSSETKKLQKKFDELNSSVSKADKAIGKFSQANSGIKALTGSVSALMGAFGISTGIYLAIDIAKNIYETTKQLQSLDLALKMVSDTQEKYAANTSFIASISNKWGLEIMNTTEQFTKFYADAKGKLSESEIKETFEGIAKAGSIMGLSIEKQKSAFTAFQQMLSKGTIQAQELKLQLGDALPGSIKVATAAYQKLHPELKVTEKLLYKHMEQGKLISSEMIPEMVKGYQKLYGIENTNNIETLNAAQNRLKNSWTDMIRTMNDSNSGGVAKFFYGATTMATDLIKLLDNAISSWDTLAKRAGEKGTQTGGAIFDEVVKNAKEGGKDLQKEIKYTVDNANKKLNELKWEESLLLDDIKKQVAKENTVSYRLARASNLGMMETPSDVMQKKRVALVEEIKIQRALIKQANTYTDPSTVKNIPTGEIDSEKKKRERTESKSEQDRLALIEKNAKIEYDLAISNAERKRNIIKSEYEDFKGSIEEKIKLSQKLALAEKTIIDLKEKESKRKAVDDKGKPDDRLFKIAENESFDATGKLLEDNTKRVQDIFKDHFNELEKMPDSIFGDKYKLTPEQEKELDKIKKLTEKSREDVMNYINSFTGDAANNLGFKETFDFFLKMDEDGKTMWQKLDSYAEGSKEKQVATFQAIAESAQEVYNFMSNLSQKRYEKDYERLERDKENALKFAGDNETQKKRIEEQYEKRRKEIARKEFNAKKQQAIVNIAIDTAQAIVGLWVKPGFPAAIPMAIAMAGLGAVQAGFVAAQKPPGFYVGTQNAPEGLAYTNERGAELHTDKKGNIKDFGDNKGARLTMLEAGDKIYTAEQTKRILFNDELNNILTSNNIMPSSINIQSNGVSATQMDAIIGKHFSNIQTNNTMIDKNGFNSWTEKNGNKTISDNNRIQRKGLIIKG